VETLTLSIADQIATVELNRPGKKNAINLEMVQEMHALLDELALRDDIAVLIVTSSDPRCFTAGADVGELHSRKKQDALSGINQNAFRHFEEFPHPTIAAVRGYALGAGTELSASCDLRVAGESARFGHPEVGLGITPAAGGMKLLMRLVGLAKAKELIFTGRVIDAKTALDIGLVNRVVRDSEVLSSAKELAREIQKNGTLAVRLAKSAMTAAARHAGENMNLIENLSQAILFEDEEKLARMKAFLDRKK
jgi:enoyl-CoA hydratase/carnithine racemase